MHASPRGTQGVAQAWVGDAGAGAGPPVCRRATQYPPPPTKGPVAVAAAAPHAGAWWAGGFGWDAATAAAAALFGVWGGLVGLVGVWGGRGFGHTAAVAAPFGGT